MVTPPRSKNKIRVRHYHRDPKSTSRCHQKKHATNPYAASLSCKIALNEPDSSVILSQANVRRIKAGILVEDLAEDIAHRGLLQSLSVSAVRDAGGNETGMYEIPGGGRCYRAF